MPIRTFSSFLILPRLGIYTETEYISSVGGWEEEGGRRGGICRILPNLRVYSLLRSNLPFPEKFPSNALLCAFPPPLVATSTSQILNYNLFLCVSPQTGLQILEFNLLLYVSPQTSQILEYNLFYCELLMLPRS